MPSPPSPPSASSIVDNDAKDGVLYGTDPNSEIRIGNSLTLVDAMAAADSIRKVYLQRSDPQETGQWFPPGMWQGAAAFAATGLLLTPFRRSILTMAGPRGPFQGFVDLVVTPILAVGAAQAGLVIGTLYGSSYYLDRLAVDAATTTRSSSGLGSDGLVAVRIDKDDKISYSPTTENLATARENMVAELCRELLSMSSSPSTTMSSSELHNQIPADSRSETLSFGPWDPRSKTMKSLLDAVDNCRRRER